MKFIGRAVLRFVGGLLMVAGIFLVVAGGWYGLGYHGAWPRVGWFFGGTISLLLGVIIWGVSSPTARDNNGLLAAIIAFLTYQ